MAASKLTAISPLRSHVYLTLKAPITTAADDVHKYFVFVFTEKIRLDIYVNPLLGRGVT